MNELRNELGSLIQPFWEPVRDFLYPPRCAACGGAVGELPWCDECARRFLRYNEPLCADCFAPKSEIKCSSCEKITLQLVVGFEYRPPLREIILAMKFQSVTSAVRPLIASFDQKISRQIAHLDADALIPIPLAEGRAYVRGYNQAEMIARALSIPDAFPVEVNLLYRIRTRQPQSKVARTERESNVGGLFAVDPVHLPNYLSKKVLLVDDVVTTGATCREATRVLESAGVKVVGWVAIAHG